jgi:hypothetical protein
VPEGYLSGIAHQKIEADGHDHVNGHIIGQIDIIIFKKERKQSQKNDKSTKPEDNYTGGK